jgi:hypothetical protein
MPPVPKHTRRWFHVGMGTLLLVTALIGTYVGLGLHLSYKRVALRKGLERDGVLFDVVRSYGPKGNPVRIRQGEKVLVLPLGHFPSDRQVAIIYFPRALIEKNLEEVVTLFPEAAIWHEPSNQPPN